MSDTRQGRAIGREPGEEQACNYARFFEHITENLTLVEVRGHPLRILQDA